MVVLEEAGKAASPQFVVHGNFPHFVDTPRIVVFSCRQMPLANTAIGNASMTKTVEQLLDEARALLPRRLSPEETLQEIGAGTMVIDIRGDEQQRQDGLIPGSVVIRRNVLEWRCDPVSPWHHPNITQHGQKIVLFCNEGYQSSLAAANLQQLGIKQATDMVGGFSSWKELGLPIAPYKAELG